MINIYVGNLPYETTEADLVELFTPYGEVTKTAIVLDRETGRPRGFGFVEMADTAAGLKAIEELAGQPFNGRPLTMNEARNKSNRSEAASSSRAGFVEPRHRPDTDEAPVGGGYSNKYTGARR